MARYQTDTCEPEKDFTKSGDQLLNITLKITNSGFLAAKCPLFCSYFRFVSFIFKHLYDVADF